MVFAQISEQKLKRIVQFYTKDYPRSEVINTSKEIKELRTSVRKYALKFNIPEHILYAIIQTESDFRYKLNHRWVRTSTFKNGKWARRRTRAIGLGGIIFDSNGHILKPLGLVKKDMHTIKYNVAAIAAILRYKINRTGSLKKGLRAYYGSGWSYPLMVLHRSKRYQ